MVTSSNNTTIIGMDSGGGSGGSLPELPPGKKMVLSKSGKVSETEMLDKVIYTPAFIVKNAKKQANSDLYKCIDESENMAFSFLIDHSKLHTHTIAINLVDQGKLDASSDVSFGIAAQPNAIDQNLATFALMLAQVQQ